jgi:hypothetical protein
MFMKYLSIHVREKLFGELRQRLENDTKTSRGKIGQAFGSNL